MRMRKMEDRMNETAGSLIMGKEKASDDKKLFALIGDLISFIEEVDALAEKKTLSQKEDNAIGPRELD